MVVSWAVTTVDTKAAMKVVDWVSKRAGQWAVALDVVRAATWAVL
jgi:hypothetical protein